LVGPEHDGIGLDYVIDKQELVDYLTNHPDLFPAEKQTDFLAFAAPEQFPQIVELLLQRGYDDQTVRGVLGGNFFRVAQVVWQ
jgi:membrane dipeptidase